MTDALTRTWRTLDAAAGPVRRGSGWPGPGRPGSNACCCRPTSRPATSTGATLAALLVLPGFEPRVRYLAAIVAPQASYLDRRASSLPAHARRSWRSLNRPVREPLVRTGRRIRRRVPPAGLSRPDRHRDSGPEHEGPGPVVISLIGGSGGKIRRRGS